MTACDYCKDVAIWIAPELGLQCCDDDAWWYSHQHDDVKIADWKLIENPTVGYYDLAETPAPVDLDSISPAISAMEIMLRQQATLLEYKLTEVKVTEEVPAAKPTGFCMAGVDEKRDSF